MPLLGDRSRPRIAAIVLIAACLGIVYFSLSSSLKKSIAMCAASKKALESEWRENPNLTARQKELLQGLEDRTLANGGTFRAEVWNAGGTVLDLHLAYDTGLEGALPSQHVQNFIGTHGPLWKLDSERGFTILNKVRAEDCTRIEVQKQASEMPVYNARLTFILRSDGRILRVTGYMDGTAEDPIETQPALSPEEARIALVQAMNWPTEGTDLIELPELTLFDPYFVSGASRNLQLSYSFAPAGTTAGFVMSATTGSLLVNGPSFTVPYATGSDLTCTQEAQSTAWLADVVLDPLTNTPAWVSFKNFNGLKIAGTDPTDRALKMMEMVPMRAMFGDADPISHLQKRSELVEGTRTIINFEQFFGGNRVDGAYLRVIVQGDRVEQLFARLPWFPAYDDIGLIDIGTARQHARDWFTGIRCGTDATCKADPAHDPLSEETVVFATELFDAPGLMGNHLAYKFEFSTVTVWWSAKTDTLLWDQRRASYATPFEIWSATNISSVPCTRDFWDPDACKLRKIDAIRSPEFTLEVDLSGTTFPPLHSDTPRMQTAMANLDAELVQLFQWDSIQGDGGVSSRNPAGHVKIIVGSSFFQGGDNAVAYRVHPNNDELQEAHVIELGSQMALPDVLAHEFTHHLTNEMLEMEGTRQEQGTLAEHYSDVVALGVFKPADGGWDLAAGSSLGPVRNMLEPKAPHTRSGAWMVDHVSLKGSCDSLHAECTYPWLGIPNRAHALIAVGAPNPVAGTTPLGRDMTAKLYFETIRPGPFRIHAQDRFVNQRAKILAACQHAVGPALMSGWSKGREITKADCENIGRAFDAVGVEATVITGFMRFNAGFSSGRWMQTIRAGARLFNGCTISGHTLNVSLRRDPYYQRDHSRTDANLPPLYVNAFGEVEVLVTERCGTNSTSTCPDNTLRTVVYDVTSKWEDALQIGIDESVNIPPGLTASDCEAPPGTAPRFYWSSPIVHTYAVTVVGDKNDRTIRPNLPGGNFVPAPCELMQLSTADIHSDGKAKPNLNTFATNFAHGGHGFTVSRLGTTTADYGAALHTWADGFNGIWARVVYQVAEPGGACGGCGFPGVVLVPGQPECPVP